MAPEHNKCNNRTGETIASVVDHKDNCNGDVPVEMLQSQSSTAEMNQDTRWSRKRKLNNSTPTAENRVYVSNIPFDLSWRELENLFAREVGNVTDSLLCVDGDGKSLGYGSITFENVESAHRALEKMNGFAIKNRKLVVHDYPKPGTDLEHDYPVKKSKFARTIWSNLQKSDFSFDNQWEYETYGINQDFLRHYNIKPPLVCRLHVTNLDPRIDKNKLREVFELAGRVVCLELGTAEDGSVKFGKIEYEHPIEAVQAISMLHQQTLYDRRMNVKMDRCGGNSSISLNLPEGLQDLGMGLGADGTPLRNIFKVINDYERPSMTQLVTAMITDPAFFNMAGKLSEHANQLTRELESKAEETLRQLEFEAREKIKSFDRQFSQQKLELERKINDSLESIKKGAFSSSKCTNESVAPAKVNIFGSGVKLFGNSNVTGNLRPSDTMMGGFLKPFSRITCGNRNVDETFNGPPKKTSNWVHVSNLPSNITWRMLRQKFQEVGVVKYVEMGVGEAKVQFNTVEDANRAVAQFDLSRICGRILNVR